MRDSKFNKESSKEKRILTLKANMKLWNRWRFMFLAKIDLSHANLRDANLLNADLRHANLSHADLSYANLLNANLRHANLSHADLSYANLSHADLSHADLRHADLDFSMLYFSCYSLKTKFEKKHIIQILYHAAKPAQNNKLDLDDDIEELFNSELFKKVVNKFHRVDECGEFTGVEK